MNTSDITLSIFILWMFTMLHSFSKLVMEMKNVNNNWAAYRCKPAVMLFADAFGHNAYENFTFCIQNIQSVFIGNALQGPNFANDVNNGNMSSANMAFGSASDSNTHTKDTAKKSTHFTMGVFSNVIIGIKRFFFSMKDIMHRASAAATVEMNSVSSGGDSISGAWDTVSKKISNFS